MSVSTDQYQTRRGRAEVAANLTGLSVAAIERYRDQPRSSFTTTRDRWIASAVKEVERQAKNDDISWTVFGQVMRKLLAPVRREVNRVFDTAIEFIEAVRDAFEAVLALLEAFADGVGSLWDELCESFA